MGHGGTLDPMATGVLVLGVGSGCRALTGYLSGYKAYDAIGRLGSATDTEDANGTEIASAPWEHQHPGKVSGQQCIFSKNCGDEIEAVCNTYASRNPNFHFIFKNETK